MNTPPTLDDISRYAFMDETLAVDALLPHTDIYREKSAAIFERAEKYVAHVREEKPDGFNAFMKEYSLNQHEGIALMCLAEALLRIPDRKTADALIDDKLSEGHWTNHFGKSDSLSVNASTFGLMLGGAIHKLDKQTPSLSGLLGKFINRLGEPVVREAIKRAMNLLGYHFVIEETIEKALKKAAKLEKKGYVFSYDMLGEGARTQSQAEGYFLSYLHAIQKIGEHARAQNLYDRPGVSIKLSALSPEYEYLKEEQLRKTLLPKVKELALKAGEHRLSLAIDAEEARRLDLSLIIFEALLDDKDIQKVDGIGFVLQAYQKRAPYVIDWLAALAKKHGRILPVRLVKGAYWDTEIKVAQALGLEGYPVYTRKSHTDIAYLACAKKLLDHPDAFYPQFATHNALTVASILEVVCPVIPGKAKPGPGISRHNPGIPAQGGDDNGNDGNYEFQRLYGMGESFYNPLLGEQRVRIYAPVGHYDALLPYLIRRLLENGANNSFVNLMLDDSQPIAKLLRDPLTRVKETHGSPREDIPLPRDLYRRNNEAARPNSKGYDFGNRQDVAALLAQIDSYRDTVWEGYTIVDGETVKGASDKVYAPFDRKHPAGDVFHARKRHVDHAVEVARKAFCAWDAVPVSGRAFRLRRAAELLEQKAAEAHALLLREAGKTIRDAVAEVREAIDFLYYYSDEAEKILRSEALPGPTGERNTLQLSGRGVFVCISPWNFPLAIFTGQIAAALVTGNSVIAKPARQTPLIATFMVRLLHEAGIPPEALHLLIGEGETIGKRLVKDPRIGGVCFTGSTGTARYIHRQLAKSESPIVPLIAETGGQNAMLVDSSALLEQAVDDIVLSAFGSAGQRCSALRVLYVQEDIADPLIAMLRGAMERLKVGNPLDFATDIGPVIDAGAKEKLEMHLQDMYRHARFLGKTEPPPETDKGSFIAPHAFEIGSISELAEEHFGPILHVVRFQAGGLDNVIKEINATGFGLTFGIHSRIHSRIDYVCSRIRAGNIYINRSMIGAVVGVQPFGGMGYSGTGPKAGGPHYLKAFCTEKTISDNITAVGGNIELINQRP